MVKQMYGEYSQCIFVCNISILPHLFVKKISVDSPRKMHLDVGNEPTLSQQ